MLCVLTSTLLCLKSFAKSLLFDRSSGVNRPFAATKQYQNSPAQRLSSSVKNYSVRCAAVKNNAKFFMRDRASMKVRA